MPRTTHPPALTQAALRERGWTPTAIRRFLGDPDRTARNPRYASAAPMKLWDEERVLAAEDTAEWRDWRLGALARAAGQKKSADDARAIARAELEEVQIGMTRMSSARLAAKAVHHRNEIADWHGRDRAHVDTVDRPTLHRWMVNYLLHEAVDLDAAARPFARRVDRDLVMDVLYRKLRTAILDAWPELGPELSRQLRERGH